MAARNAWYHSTGAVRHRASSGGFSTGGSAAVVGTAVRCATVTAGSGITSRPRRHPTYSNKSSLAISQSRLLQTHRNLHSSHATMSSDDAYSAFLDKANQDTGYSGAPGSQQKKYTASATATRENVHPAIAKVHAYYVSDSDEPFEPVSFDWDGGDSIDESSFESLLSADADVSSLTPKEFDPKNRYQKVLQAVGECGNGEIFVFKVDFGGTRLEYYVVSITDNKGQVQGMKALAIES